MTLVNQYDDFDNLKVEDDDGVMLVTLSRPKAMNALDAKLMSELKRLWQMIPDSARCLVIIGEGKGFCAGGDMSLLSGDRGDASPTAREELSFLPGEQVDCPVIAAVNGVCAGGGLHFVADADFSVAAESATFIDPHVSVGQVTALEPLTLRLRMRPDVLSRMALIGSSERLTAGQAQAAGLVSEVVPDEELRNHVLRLASKIAQNSPAAVTRSRSVLREIERDLIGQDRLEQGWNEIREHWSHPDCNEGPSAFIEKRRPEWKER